MSGVRLVGLDADDTLWPNELIFLESRQRFQDMLAAYHDPAWIAQRLGETESRNLQHFGYGIKGFALSMIETAVQLTEGRVTGGEVAEIIEMAKSMVANPIRLFDNVHEVVRDLTSRYQVVIITKGDLFDQEAKIARSGLGDLVDGVHVVSEKKPVVYAEILEGRGVAASQFVMVGNSLRSDVLPVVEIGGHAIMVPYEHTWVHEEVAEDVARGHRYHQVASIVEVPAVVVGL